MIMISVSAASMENRPRIGNSTELTRGHRNTVLFRPVCSALRFNKHPQACAMLLSASKVNRTPNSTPFTSQRNKKWGTATDERHRLRGCKGIFGQPRSEKTNRAANTMMPQDVRLHDAMTRLGKGLSHMVQRQISKSWSPFRTQRVLRTFRPYFE
jgi:hypothetical protein